MPRLVPNPIGDITRKVDVTLANVDDVLGRVDATLVNVDTKLGTVETTLTEATSVLGQVKTLLADLSDKLVLLDRLPDLAAKVEEIHTATTKP